MFFVWQWKQMDGIKLRWWYERLPLKYTGSSQQRAARPMLPIALCPVPCSCSRGTANGGESGFCSERLFSPSSIPGHPPCGSSLQLPTYDTYVQVCCNQLTMPWLYLGIRSNTDCVNSKVYSWYRQIYSQWHRIYSIWKITYREIKEKL
jgi:hypothetical protein